MTKFPSGNDPSSNGPSSSGPSGDGAPAHIDSGSAGCLGLTVDTAWETNTESSHRKPTPKQTSSARTDVQWPLFLSPVQAVFPSPADDYIETTLDLNEALVDNETVDNETSTRCFSQPGAFLALVLFASLFTSSFETHTL